MFPETCLANADEWIEVAGFRVIHSVRVDHKIEGETKMPNDVLTARELTFLNVNNNVFEITGNELALNGDKYVFIGVYCLFSSSLLRFKDTFPDLLENDIGTSGPRYTAGICSTSLH